MTRRGCARLGGTLLLMAAVAGGVRAEPRPEPIEANARTARVETTSGTVLGYRQGRVHAFKGLPYATAERFRAPQPVAPWPQPRSSRSWGPSCPQQPGRPPDELRFVIREENGAQDEQCLNLNVWSTDLRVGAKQPVMVWLHGGAYSTGSARATRSTEGQSLAERGVVVVSLNHRLNVLGFLDLGAHGPAWQDAGNAGLLDIVAGLRWVRDNIAAFGGDPDNVTVFGQSGGGSKVANLMVMPAAQGLFHKAIVQSSFRTRLQVPAVTRQVARALFRRLGLQDGDVEALRTMRYPALAEAGDAALREVRAELERAGQRFSFVGFGWEPVLDGRLLPYPTDDPRAAALASRVPLVVGSTLNEFAIAAKPAALRGADAEAVGRALERRYGSDAAAFRRAHAEAWPQSTDPHDLLDIDADYRLGALQLARRHAAAGGAPVWLYQFAWRSPQFDGAFKAGHGADVPFAFDAVQRAVEQTGGGDEAYRLADAMSAAWVAFARQGDPRHAGLPDWPAWTPGNGATLVFDRRTELRRHHDDALLQLMQRHP